MTFNDRAVAVIRTAVPVLVGSLIAWLTARIPVIADVIAWIDTNVGSALGAPVVKLLELGAVALVIIGYYALVRWLAKRWPWLEAFLGSTKTPAAYTSGAGQTTVVGQSPSVVPVRGEWVEDCPEPGLRTFKVRED